MLWGMYKRVWDCFRRELEESGVVGYGSRGKEEIIFIKVMWKFCSEEKFNS